MEPRTSLQILIEQLLINIEAVAQPDSKLAVLSFQYLPGLGLSPTCVVTYLIQTQKRLIQLSHPLVRFSSICSNGTGSSGSSLIKSVSL